MKKLLFILVFFFSFFQLNAQSYRIYRSAVGELVGFRTLWNQTDLFGYFELHYIERKEDKTSLYKYVVLDRNMNEVSNGEFTVPHLIENEMFSICQYNNGKILLSIDGNTYGTVLRRNEIFKIIDLKSGTVSDAISLINKELKTGAEIKPAIGEYNFNKGIVSFNIKNNGFLLTEREMKGSKSFYKAGTMIDLEGKKMWSLPIIPGETDKHFYEYSYFSSDDNVIALLGQYYKKMEGSLQKTEAYKLGIYRKIYDKNNGQLISDKKVAYLDLKKYVDIDEAGKIKKEGTLYFNDFEVRPDGTNLVFGETYKVPNFFNGFYRFTELFSIILDDNFEIKEMKSYNVNETFEPKYSYGQSLKNNKGYVSVFIDKNENKKLFLNTLVYNDDTKEFKNDKIELEKTGSNISYFPAKNGYIGIIEYFKKTKEEKRVAELRLEKINAE